MPVDNTPVMASDGLLARSAGAWAREKLAVLASFLPPALTITGSFGERVFVDAFAGPGLNRTESGIEFDGSPLLALTARGQGARALTFSRAELVTFEEWEHEALQARIARAQVGGRIVVPPAGIHQHQGDANVKLLEILAAVPRQSAYTLLVADITSPRQLPFRTLESARALRHRSLDLYVLFPLEMSILRALQWDGADPALQHVHLDAYFGTPAWRDIYAARKSSGQSADLKQALIDLYARQLRTLWRHVDLVAAPGKSEAAPLYRMFFATDHAAAAKIARGAAKRPTTPDAQLGFL